MRCRRIICAGCCTRVEGVNHCHACLKALGRRTTQPAATSSAGVLMSLLVLGLAWLLFFGVLWFAQGRLSP